MAVLPILRLGNPILHQKACPVDTDKPQYYYRLIRDMTATMLAANGAGLAAPQIGQKLRVIVFHLPKARLEETSTDQPFGPTYLLNPSFQPAGDDKGPQLEYGIEGCLSMPYLRGIVSRWHHIIYTGYNAQGQEVQGQAKGIHARIIQHECDHLDGILFFDRIQDRSLFGYREEIELQARNLDIKYHKSAGDIT